jgi:hypothetical protein
MIRKTASAFALIALLFSTPALAGKQGAAAAKPDGSRREKILETIEIVRFAKTIEALNLDQTQGEKLALTLKPFQDQRKTTTADRMDVLRSIKQQLDSDTPDPKAVGDLMDRLSADQKALADNQKDEYEALKKILDPVTLAKYYRFNLEFDRNVGQLIQTLRGGPNAANGAVRRRFQNQNGVPQDVPPE